MSVDSFPPARTPRGVTTSITTSNARFSGELIEMRDSGVVILAEKTFRLIPYGAIVASRFEGMKGSDKISDRRPPKAEVREHLRLVSRFPQGLTPQLLRRLLDANRQADLAGEAL